MSAAGRGRFLHVRLWLVISGNLGLVGGFEAESRARLSVEGRPERLEASVICVYHQPYWYPQETPPSAPRRALRCDE